MRSNKYILSEKSHIKQFDANKFSTIDDEVYKEVFNLEKDYMKKYDSFVFSLIYKVTDSFDNSVCINDTVELKHLKLLRSLLKFKIVPDLRQGNKTDNKWMYFVNKKKLLHLKEKPTPFTFWKMLYKFYIPKKD